MPVVRPLSSSRWASAASASGKQRGAAREGITAGCSRLRSDDRSGWVWLVARLRAASAGRLIAVARVNLFGRQDDCVLVSLDN
jgi:hypothetical protein